MIRRSAPARRIRCTAVSLLAVWAALAGCGPIEDSSLKLLGFKQGGATISVYKDDLRASSPATIDVEFQNSGMIVGQKGGVGILLKSARIVYMMDGHTPPIAQFPVSLYLAPPADGATTTATLSAFPLAPLELRAWLLATGAFNNETETPVVQLVATVTFSGKTEDGSPVETSGTIAIALTNTEATVLRSVPPSRLLANAAAPARSALDRCGAIAGTSPGPAVPAPLTTNTNARSAVSG